MSCLSDPISCVTAPITGGVSDIVSSAWDGICQSFADAATSVLTSFAKAFVAIPDVDLSSAGLRNVYAISLGLSSLVAVFLLLGQVIRTAMTHGKASLAFMLTLTVASTALLASDEVTTWIVNNGLGGTQAFSDKISKLFTFAPGTSGALLLIFGILGILLTIVLWFEMLMRNAAIAVLIATSPISAAGMVSEGTKGWWSKLVTSTVQLIILKPIVALVFVLGFGLAGDSQDLETTLSGMLVLLLAALSWPSIARFFAFANVQAGGGAGLGALLGFAGGRLSAQGAGGPGIDPDDFGAAAADRTMASFASKGGTGQAVAGAVGGGQAAGAGAASGAAAGAAAGPMGMAAAVGVRLAQQAANSIAGGMDRMAGHAGMQPNAGAPPAGYVPRYGNGQVSGSRRDEKSPIDWSGATPPSETSGQDNQQALVEGTPELPVTDGQQASDPPTIEFPAVPSELDTTAPPATSEQSPNEAETGAAEGIAATGLPSATGTAVAGGHDGSVGPGLRSADPSQSAPSPAQQTEGPAVSGAGVSRGVDNSASPRPQAAAPSQPPPSPAPPSAAGQAPGTSAPGGPAVPLPRPVADAPKTPGPTTPNDGGAK